MTDEEAQTWLRGLSKSIWRSTPGNNGSLYYIESRELTSDEWVMFLDIAPKFLCEMHNACMGFGIGMMTYAHPTFPGLLPEGLVFVTSKHIPESVLVAGKPADTHGRTGRFDVGWDAFSPITHRDQNREWLKLYGLEAPREKDHYDY